MSLKLFSKNLRYIRLRRGFKTQEALAKRLNVSSQTISVWENGYGYPTSHEMLIKLCDTLRVSSIDSFIRKDMTKARSGRINLIITSKA